MDNLIGVAIAYVEDAYGPYHYMTDTEIEQVLGDAAGLVSYYPDNNAWLYTTPSDEQVEQLYPVAVKYFSDDDNVEEMDDV